jgi:GGDEF domain-containing protein
MQTMFKARRLLRHAWEVFLNHENNIVIFSGQAATATPQLLGGCIAHSFAGFDEFQQVALKPAAFVVKSDSESYTRTLLRQIRRDRDNATALVFTYGTVADSDEPLSDGPMPSTREALLNRIGDMQKRAQAMQAHGDHDTPEARLIEYLWLRPGYVLEPKSDWKHPQRYYYPILELLDHSESDSDIYLQKMDREGLLEKVALKDRQRECDFCGSAHLSFIDVCPNCRSIEIDQHTALHCFTCGLIAPEERFVNGSQRGCPKCGANLRHIGTDYDRPLETCVCASCEHVFVEGEVVARCAICAHSMPPPSLRLHKFYSWRLGAAGRLAAQGNPEITRGYGISANQNGRDNFVASVEWMLKMMQTQKDLHFVLMSLHLINRKELESTLGSANAARLVEAYVERLREALNDADLLVRSDDENILIMIPHFERKHVAQIHMAIKTLSEQAQQQDSIGPAWDIRDLQVNAKIAERETAESLLSHLREPRDTRHRSVRAA